MQGLKLSSMALGAQQTAASGGGGGGGGWADDFGGVAGTTIAAASLSGYTTQNAASLPLIDQVNGRYRAQMQSNTGNVTLFWTNGSVNAGVPMIGRRDYKLFDVPASGTKRFIARRAQVCAPGSPATAVSGFAGEYLFCGIQIGAVTLDATAANYVHIVAGYRGGALTVEWKRTSGTSNSSQGDVGSIGSPPNPQADLMLEIDSSRTVTGYWRAPGDTLWTSISMSGTQPNLGSGSDQIAVAVVTYCFDQWAPAYDGMIDGLEYETT